MVLALSLLASFLTLAAMWLAGRKDRRAWMVGLVGQANWVAFAIATKGYGLILDVPFVTVIYINNLRQWKEPA